MSPISDSGFDGVSRKNIRVDGVMAAAQASTSTRSTNWVETPNRDRYFSNSTVVVPNTERDDTMESPDFSNAMTVANIALIPDAVAIQRSAPSRAASRVSKAATVGLEKRE